MMEKVFGDAAANVENGIYSVLIILMIFGLLFVLAKFGRRGDKGGNPKR